jgi:hypothetical protein
VHGRSKGKISIYDCAASESNLASLQASPYTSYTLPHFLQDSKVGKGKRKRAAIAAVHTAESLSDSDVELIPCDATKLRALASGSSSSNNNNSSSSSAKMDSGFSVSAGD